MASQRKRFRDQIKALIQANYKGAVYTSRVTDARDLNEFVTVRMTAGEYESEGFELTKKANLQVVIYKRESQSDDQLDEIADQIEDALADESSLDESIHLLVPSGYEYQDDEESAFSALALNFTITYT